MGSAPPNSKRQRLALSPAISSVTASRPLADSTTSLLPQQSTTNQHPFCFKLQQHDQLRSVESKPSTPTDPLPRVVSAPFRPKSKRHLHDQEPDTPTNHDYQHQNPGPTAPVDGFSYPPSYFFGMEQKTAFKGPEPITTTHTPSALPALPFPIPHHALPHSNYPDAQLLYSSLRNDSPVMTNLDDSHRCLSIPSTPLSAQSFEEKHGGHSSESGPSGTGPKGAPLQRRNTKASQACSSCRQLKTKCDEKQPCKSCSDRGFECIYYAPASRSMDNTQPAVLNAVLALQDTLTEFQAEVHDLKDRMNHLEHTITAFSQVDARVQAKFNRWMLDLMRGHSSPPLTNWGLQEQGYFSDFPQQ